MNGKSLYPKYEIVNVKKAPVLDINPKDVLKEAEENGMSYHILGVNIPMDKLNDPLLYHPGMNGTSSTAPFNPFYFVREELIPIYSACGKEIKNSKLFHISSDYGQSIIMDNICIILEYGLFGQLRKFLVPGTPTDRFNDECVNVIFECRNTLRFSLDDIMRPFGTKKDCDYQLTLNNVPTVIFKVCEVLSRSLSDFIVNIITLGCIDIKSFNMEINEESKKSIGNIIHPDDLDCDVSSIISYLTFVMNDDIRKISEVIEIGVVGAIDFEMRSNDIYNQYNAHCPRLKEMLATDLNTIDRVEF